MQDELVHGELIRRRNDLFKISKSTTFFEELIRLVTWIESIPQFSTTVEGFNQSRKDAEHNERDTCKKLKVVVLKMWDELYPKITDEMRSYIHAQYVVNAKLDLETAKSFEYISWTNELIEAVKSDDLKVADAFAHLRTIIYELASSELSAFRNVVIQWTCCGVNNHDIRVCGDGMELLATLNRHEQLRKDRESIEEWGAWDQCMMIRFFQNEWGPRFKDTVFSNSYKVNEYKVYINRVVDSLVNNLDYLREVDGSVSQVSEALRISDYKYETKNREDYGWIFLANGERRKIGKRGTRGCLLMDFVSGRNFYGTFNTTTVYSSTLKKGEVSITSQDQQFRKVKQIVGDLQRGPLKGIWCVRKADKLANNLVFH